MKDILIILAGIEKLQRGLAFRHKGSYRMLSALCFDSERDWKIIKTK